MAGGYHIGQHAVNSKSLKVRLSLFLEVLHVGAERKLINIRLPKPLLLTCFSFHFEKFFCFLFFLMQRRIL